MLKDDRRSPWGRRRRRGPFGGGLHGAAAALRGGGAAPGAVGGGNGGTGVAEAVPTRRGRIAGVETWKKVVCFFSIMICNWIRILDQILLETAGSFFLFFCFHVFFFFFVVVVALQKWNLERGDSVDL